MKTVWIQNIQRTMNDDEQQKKKLIRSLKVCFFFVTLVIIVVVVVVVRWLLSFPLLVCRFHDCTNANFSSYIFRKWVLCLCLPLHISLSLTLGSPQTTHRHWLCSFVVRNRQIKIRSYPKIVSVWYIPRDDHTWTSFRIIGFICCCCCYSAILFLSHFHCVERVICDCEFVTEEKKNIWTNLFIFHALWIFQWITTTFALFFLNWQINLKKQYLPEENLREKKRSKSGKKAIFSSWNNNFLIFKRCMHNKHWRPLRLSYYYIFFVGRDDIYNVSGVIP